MDSNDGENDTEMEEEDREPSKSVTNFNRNDTQLNPSGIHFFLYVLCTHMYYDFYV